MRRRTLGVVLLSLIALTWLTAAGQPFNRILRAVNRGFAAVEEQLTAIEDELRGLATDGAQVVVIHKEFETSLYPSPGLQVRALNPALRIPSELTGTLLQASCQMVVWREFTANFRARWFSDGQEFEICNSRDGLLHNDGINLPVQGGERVNLECFGEDLQYEQPCSVQLHLWLELERAE